MSTILSFPIINKPDPFDDQIEKDHNQNWERFLATAKMAYEWRDHDSLDELLQIVGLLRPWILRSAPKSVAEPSESVQTPRENNVISLFVTKAPL